MSTTTQIKVRTFEENVAIVRKGLIAFAEMGMALKQIRDLKQYEKKYGTGTGYASCLKAEFGITTQYAGQLIAAAEVVSRLKSETIVSVLPSKEAPVRELRKAPTADQPKVWNEAVKEANKNGKTEPTAKEVKKAVDEKLVSSPTTSTKQKEEAKARLNKAATEEKAKSTPAVPRTLDNLRAEIESMLNIFYKQYPFSRIQILNVANAVVVNRIKSEQKAIANANKK